MNRKSLIPFLLLIISLTLMNCSEDCEITLDTCREEAPTNEICAASFSRWFYDQDKNKCELVGYSGCNPAGFATQKECESCKCG